MKQGRFWVASPLFEQRGAKITLDSQARGDANNGDLVLVGGGKRGAARGARARPARRGARTCSRA